MNKKPQNKDIYTHDVGSSLCTRLLSLDQVYCVSRSVQVSVRLHLNCFGLWHTGCKCPCRYIFFTVDVISLLRITVFPVDIRMSVLICLCNHTERQTDKNGEESTFSNGTHPDWATAQFSLTVPSPSHWSQAHTHTHTMTHADIMSAAYPPLLLSNIHSSQYSVQYFQWMSNIIRKTKKLCRKTWRWWWFQYEYIPLMKSRISQRKN